VFDAWGKPPEGLFTGHVNALGDFDECVDLLVRDVQLRNPTPGLSNSFDGRYCQSYLLPYNETRHGRPSSTRFSHGGNHSRKAVSPQRLIVRKNGLSIC
jgi:hypothetical protein